MFCLSCQFTRRHIIHLAILLHCSAPQEPVPVKEPLSERRLCAGGLKRQSQALEALRRHLSATFGPVERVEFPPKKYGFAFVVFERGADARAALAAPKQKFEGYRVELKPYDNAARVETEDPDTEYVASSCGASLALPFAGLRHFLISVSLMLAVRFISNFLDFPKNCSVSRVRTLPYVGLYSEKHVLTECEDVVCTRSPFILMVDGYALIFAYA